MYVTAIRGISAARARQRRVRIPRREKEKRIAPPPARAAITSSATVPGRFRREGNASLDNRVLADGVSSREPTWY